jgi:hypothetical protein
MASDFQHASQVSRRNLLRIGAVAVPALVLLGGNTSRARAATTEPAATTADTTAVAAQPASAFVYFC